VGSSHPRSQPADGPRVPADAPSGSLRGPFRIPEHGACPSTQLAFPGRPSAVSMPPYRLSSGAPHQSTSDGHGTLKGMTTGQRPEPIHAGVPSMSPRGVDPSDLGKVMYLVFSHVNPPQVARLVRLLRAGSSDSHVVLHHDEASSHLDPELLAGLANVHVLPYRPIAWGTFSWVNALLRAIRWALEYLEFEWLVLLSGQDYPTQSVSSIERFLATTEYDGFLKGFPLGSRPETAGEDLQRYLYRYYRIPVPSQLRSRFTGERGRGVRVARTIQGAQPIASLKRGPSGLYVGVRRLRLPFDEEFRWYRGSTWFTLSRQSVAVLDRFVRTNARVMRYFRRMWIPEESFVATVLLNQPDLRLCSDHLRFIRFRGGRHPDILTIRDADAVLSSGKHFGRKFDTRVDDRILDVIDEQVHATASN
jgi:hypothetical protein